MKMIEKIASAMWDDIGGDCGQEDCRWLQNIENCFCQKAAFRLAKLAINALREPQLVDDKILLAIDHYAHVGAAKQWDAALDQIIDPDN